MQLQFNQELCKHGVDPIQSDVVLGIETVPDVPNCTIVLGDVTEGVIDKRYNSPWMHILLCFGAYIDSIDVASLLAMRMPGQE